MCLIVVVIIGIEERQWTRRTNVIELEWSSYDCVDDLSFYFYDSFEVYLISTVIRHRMMIVMAVLIIWTIVQLIITMKVEMAIEFDSVGIKNTISTSRRYFSKLY